MASTLTTFDAFLKERYADENEVERLVVENHEFLDMIERDASGSGKYFDHPVVVGNPQGLGATLAKAQTASEAAGGGGNIQGKDWISNWGDYSGAITVGDKVIKAARDSAGSFLRNKAEEVDGLYRSFGDTMEYYLFADAGRALATGTISSGVVTLVAATESDIVNIQEGSILVASANDGTSSGHTLLGSGSVGYVIGVNPNAGTFTVSATAGGAAGTPSGWTGTMFFFRDGDFGGGTQGNRILLGAGAWIPSSDPGATAFEGVDRTLNIQKLSGTRLTNAEISGLGLEGRLKKLVMRMVGRGVSPGPTVIFMNPEKWQPLADSLESRGQRLLDGGSAIFNYKKISLAMSGRNVDIVSARFCPYHTAFALHTPTIKLRSMDKFPFVVNGDGLDMMRMASSNSYELRLQAYPAVIFAAPGYCGRVSTL